MPQTIGMYTTLDENKKQCALLTIVTKDLKEDLSGVRTAVANLRKVICIDSFIDAYKAGVLVNNIVC